MERIGRWVRRTWAALLLKLAVACASRCGCEVNTTDTLLFARNDAHEAWGWVVRCSISGSVGRHLRRGLRRALQGVSAQQWSRGHGWSRRMRGVA